MSVEMTEPVGRRNFAQGLALGNMAWAAGEDAASPTWFDVRRFGAKGDGKADDTKAIQAAVDAAGEKGGAVWVPPGTYQSGEIRLRRGVGMVGVPGWGYRGPGGSVLRLIDEKASCLLNITGAFGATIDGLSLEGARLGKQIHGIFLNKPDYGKEEDAFRIERCQVARFSGTGVMLSRVWCFSIRHSMIAYSGGDGIRCLGWDGFVLDNWLSGNRGCGWEGTGSASVTMTGNRIEWNRRSGILVAAGSHYNVTGNYIDRSGGPGITLEESEKRPARHLAITGNVIYRSGKWAEAASQDSAQIRLSGARGVTLIGNSLVVGRDDGGRGQWSPSYGIILEKLGNAVVKDNVLHDGALTELLADRGGHAEGVIVRDNPGQLFRPPEK
jgi:hypothetical protein